MRKITLLMVLAFVTMFVNAATLPVTADFSNVTTSSKLEDFPTGWTYITNNEAYPNPGYYAGGMKYSFINQGMESPVFDAQSSVKITMNVAKLNANTKTEAGGDNVFTITGLDASGAVVATAVIPTVSIGDNVVILTSDAANIVKVKMIFTAYPHNGTKLCNLSLKSATVAVNSGGGTGDAVELPVTYAQLTYYEDYSMEGSHNFGLDICEVNGNYIAAPYLILDIYSPVSTSVVGTYSDENGGIDLRYSVLFLTDAQLNASAPLALSSAEVTLTYVGANQGYNVYDIVANVTAEDNVTYTVNKRFIVPAAKAVDTDGDGRYDDYPDYELIETPSGIAVEKVDAADRLHVVVENGEMIIPAEVGQLVEVFTATGQKVYSQKAEGEIRISDMAKNQILIVRVNGKVAKVKL